MIKKLTLTAIIFLGVIACFEKKTFKIDVDGREYIISATNINDSIVEGETPLIYAINSGNYDLAKFAIRNGADVNAKDNDGDTALMWASSCGLYEFLSSSQVEEYLEIVKYLVENGADVNAKNNYCVTALMKADSEEIKEVLRKAGAK